MRLYNVYLLVGQGVLLLAMGQWANGTECSPGKQMELVFQWKLLDFLWPSEKAREKAIKSGEYVPENVTAYEINVYEGRYFLTLPRFKYGSPATFTTISNKTRNGEYLLDPFPSWEKNRLGNCDGLTSVWRTQIDGCGRLWVLDSGVVDVINKVPDRICQPKLEVYDLNDGDKLIGSYVFTDNVLDCNSLVLGLQVDIRSEDCSDDNIFVYMTDCYAHHLVVFDLHHKKFYRSTQSSFYPDPHYIDFTIDGTRVFIIDAPLTVALGPVCNGDRRVYYHALVSVEECYVMASTLRDKAYWTNENAYPDSYYCYSSKKPSQSAGEVMTPDGIMFYDLKTLNAVACWNSETDYYFDNTAIVARNDTTMQGMEALTLVGDELYVVSMRLQLVITYAISGKEINFRVLRRSVPDLLCGTPCVKPCPANGTDCNSA